jgi:two-component system KDP operon response regulator KdpE
MTELPDPEVRGNDLDDARVSKPRVLIVDDDNDYVGMLKLILRQAEYDVSGANDYQSAVQKCVQVQPDLILLDLMMPSVDGYGIFDMLRNVTRAPIIFISAAPRDGNLVRSLEIGAEDYISKPFQNSELLARIRKALRQAKKDEPITARYFPDIELRVDFESREVTLGGRAIRLLPREFAVLKVLAEQAPRNVPYERITSQLWGQDSPKARAHLKTIVFALRRKMEKDPLVPALLVNNRGLGYQLEIRPADA